MEDVVYSIDYLAGKWGQYQSASRVIPHAAMLATKALQQLATIETQCCKGVDAQCPHGYSCRHPSVFPV